MKTKIKISFLGALFLTALFLSSSNCLAVEKMVADAKKQATTVATVNIYSAKIISQEGNVLKIGFDLNNRIGIQSGIRYGIELRTKNESPIVENQKIYTYTKSNLVDQKIYPESVTLGAGEVIKKEIDYIAPEYLQGKFEVFVVSENESGLPLGNVLAGETELNGSGNYLKIDSSECFIEVSGRDGSKKMTEIVSVSSEEEIKISCWVFNLEENDVSAIPFLETKMRSNFGPAVSEIKGDSVQFKVGEKTNLEMVVSKPDIPQVYSVRLNMRNAKSKTISNPIDFSYSIKGTSATIQNATFDMNGYLKGNGASVTVLWNSQSAIINQETGEKEKIFLKIAIFNREGVSCTEPFEAKLDGKTYSEIETFKVPIIEACQKPQIEVSLTDEKGTVLDEKILGFQEEKILVQKSDEDKGQSGKSLAFWLYLIAGIILIIGIGIIIIAKKKGGMIGVITLVFLSGMMLTDTVRADTSGIASVARGKDGISVPGAGSVLPGGAEIFAYSFVTYSHDQCNSTFNGTVYVGHIDDSGVLLNFDRLRARLTTAGYHEYTDDGTYTENTISKGSGSGSITIEMDWAWRYLVGGKWHNETDIATEEFTYNTSCAPPNPAPFGNHDGANNANCSISGWAMDDSDRNQSLQVHVYRDGPAGIGTLVKVSTANFSRPDVQWLYGAPMANYGFNTLSLRGTAVDNASPHSIYVYAIDIPGGGNPLLSGSPKMIFCDPPAVCTGSCPVAGGATCGGTTATGLSVNTPWTYSETCSGSVKCQCDCPAGQCNVEGTCVSPGTKTYFCSNTVPVCSSEEKCTTKTGTAICASSDMCGTNIEALSACSNCVAQTVTCPCPSKNWIEVAP